MNINLEAEIKYYFREKCYGKVQKIVKQILLRNSNDNLCVFYNGLSLVLSGRYQEGIRELNIMQSFDDLSLATTMCLIHAHKRSPSIDKETIQHLELKMKEYRRSTTPLSMHYAALFFFFTDRLDKASDIISKIMKIDNKFSQGIILKGWIDMYKNPNNLTQKIADCFENYVSNDDLDALLGLITFKYLQKDYASAIILLDSATSKYPYSELFSIEKMKNELALFNWDQVLDITDDLLNKDIENIHGMKHRILYTICKKGDYIDATDLLVKYFDLLERNESKNPEIFYDSAKLFSCICGRSSSILSQTYRYIKYAAELQPTNVEYLTELGFQCLIQNMLKDAVHFFKSATKVDDNSINALLGLTMCQMAENGPSEQVEQQIELLNELMGGNQKHPRLLLMSAKLERKYPEKAVSILIECGNVHISKSHYIPFGFEYLKFLNPDFILEVIEEYLRHAPKKPMVILDKTIFNFEEVLPAMVLQCFKLLEILIMACPGLALAVYRLSKLQFQYGRTEDALQNAQNIIENIDQSFANAYLLLAQIYVQQNLFNKTEQNLEICLSYNFKVRDNPMYHLLQGIVMKNKKKYTEALACYTSSLNLIETKSNVRKGKNDIDYDLILPDKATLYLELITTHTTLGQYNEANKIMQTAVQEFALTTEEPRLTIANAELALNGGDVDKCIELLTQVKPGQSYYLQAHTKLAHVYLKEKNDRAMFASCFRELVANHPGYDAHIMLGDAYLSIHEPRHAVEAFQKALEQNPHELDLIKKMGIALVKMHLYDKAVKHYIEAIEILNSPELKIELAELYFKLKRYDKAEEVLKVEIENPSNFHSLDTASMKFQTKILMLLAKVKERNPKETNKKATLITLKDARENQIRLVKRAQLESHPDLDDEKKILCEICAQLAAQYANNKSIEQAIQTYKEALQYSPQHPPILLALANLYMQSNEPELCQQTCSILLNADPENEAASVMMAELAFRKVDFETASFHLKQLLTSQPSYWTALEKLTDVQRRLGNLEEVSTFLTKAQEAGFSEEPGYLYCAGLFARYNGDPNVALRHWGRARRAEGRWGRCAALGVIKVCLSPGGEALPPPINEDGLSDPNDDAEYRDTRSFALSMAERLLNELQNSGSYDMAESLELKLLGIRLTIAGRKKSSVESALRMSLQMASEDGSADDIGVAVTIASAHIVLKQSQRARNQLKRVSRIPWTPEKAEWLEMCWVLLAECLISAGNTTSNIEAAKDCLERALKHNKSCTQAYECFGYLAEKDQSYKEAADYYENAWKYGGLGNASIGYKYALCLLKAKKYAEAISVSRDVLIAHPDCPKIRKDVLEKASCLLRM